MKLLVVAATEPEIAPLLDHFGLAFPDTCVHPDFDVLITGVGMTATAYALGKILRGQYGLILNLGVAGSFHPALPPGTIVNVVMDSFSELGAASPEGFLTIDELKLGTSTFRGEPVQGLQHVVGITVNTIHGREPEIGDMVKRLAPETESMEGAAVFYCAAQSGIPCIQVRAISNFVEPRNRANWDLAGAIANLNKWAIAYLTQTR